MELNDIVKKVELLPFDAAHLGLKGGSMGIVLFFFLYARIANEETYEDKAYTLLEKVIDNISSDTPLSYSLGVAGIGGAIHFLLQENFVEASSPDLLEDIDKITERKLNKDMPVDLGFETGIIGLCHYLLQRSENTDAPQTTLEHLLSGFGLSEHRTHCIDPLFLFPSEILEDLKIFLLHLKERKVFSKQISLLDKAVEDFEKNNIVLQSNCQEYFMLQALRKAGLKKDVKNIRESLSDIANMSTDIILQGLSRMSIENPALPAWWKLF
jgi:hypothetical protein